MNMQNYILCPCKNNERSKSKSKSYKAAKIAPWRQNEILMKLLRSGVGVGVVGGEGDRPQQTTST